MHQGGVQSGLGTELGTELEMQSNNESLCEPSMRVGTQVQGLEGCELSNLGVRGLGQGGGSEGACAGPSS